jgi:hypothetical protein
VGSEGSRLLLVAARYKFIPSGQRLQLPRTLRSPSSLNAQKILTTGSPGAWRWLCLLLG